MGMLLAQYEFQRAKQRVNVLQARSLHLNDLQERYSKRIAKIEKQYSKKQTQIENKYNQMQSMYTSQINTAASSSGKGQFNLTISSSIFGGLDPLEDITRNYRQIVDAKLAKDENGNVKEGQKLTDTEDLSAWKTACTAVCNQLTTLLSGILTEMKDAEIEMLEFEEDQIKQPLTEKDSEIQSDIATNESLLSFQKERRDAARTALDDAIKNSVAHYGLGG